MRKFHFEEFRRVWPTKPSTSLSSMDPNSPERWELVQRHVLAHFVSEGRPIYKIADGLGHDLDKANLEVAARFLKSLSGKPICIEFPDWFAAPAEGTESITCAYVSSYWSIEAGAVSYHIIFPTYDRATNRYTGRQAQLTKTFSIACENMQEELKRDVSNDPWLEPVFQYLVKCLLYIQSGQPDLRAILVEPKQGKKNVRPKELAHEKAVPAVDFTLVGYDWKKQRKFQTDSTEVRGHWRWQPYGPGLSKVKFIWIDAHERSYRAVKPPQMASTI